MISWLGFAGAVGFILVIGWGFVGDFDEWWNGPSARRRTAADPEPTWFVETLAEIRSLPEVHERKAAAP